MTMDHEATESQNKKSSDGDFEKKLYNWVEDSGRALELRVARLFKQTNVMSVDVSRRYQGTDGGEAREIDVAAVYRTFVALEPGHLFQMLVTVECKSGAEKPWVVFYDDSRRKNSTALVDNTTVGMGDSRQEKTIQQILGGWLPFREWQVGTHIVDANFSGRDKGGYSNSANAVRQALSAAEGLGDIEAKGARARMQGSEVSLGKVYSCAVAVVVTNARLFQCWLDKTSGEIKLNEVSRASVWVSDAAAERKRVFVVREQELPSFASELSQAFGAVEEELLRSW